MKKIILAISVILLLALGAYWLKTQQQNQDNTRLNPQSQNKSQQSPSTDVKTLTEYSYRDLVEGKKNLKCSYEELTGDTDTKGILYVDSANQRVAMDMNVKTKQEDGTMQDMKMNAIVDKDYMHTWSKDFPGEMKGMKIKIDKDAAGNPDNEQIDMDKKIKMSCDDWRVDESMFKLPSDIQFTDMSEMMKNMMNTTDTINTGNTQSIICNTCDAIKDAQAKQMCKQQNNCK